MVVQLQRRCIYGFHRKSTVAITLPKQKWKENIQGTIPAIDAGLAGEHCGSVIWQLHTQRRLLQVPIREVRDQ